MKRIAALLILLCILVSNAAAEDTLRIPLPQSPGEQAAGLDAALADIFPRFRTTGAVVVVAKAGEVVYRYDYGYANKQGQEPVTPETYFRVASVTKLVSAIRVMQLVEDGLLDLDAPIGDYLGFEVLNTRHKREPITLRQLMTHTSSISDSGGFSSNLALNDFLDASRRRNGNWNNRAPGSKYQYSNFGAGLMGSLMEAVTGQNVNDTMHESVFDPLGIDAAYHISLLGNPEKAAYIYYADGKLKKSPAAYLRESWDPAVDPNRHYGLTYGSLWIRGDDLIKLGIALCEGGEVDGIRLLEPDTIELMMSSQKDLGAVSVDSPYGLCVHRVSTLLDDRMIYGHQGRSDGVLCNLYFEPQSRLVFVLITNGSSTKQSDYVANLTRAVFVPVWAVWGE